MEPSNFYELQQQQLAAFSSLAAAQSSTALPPIQQWNPSLPLNNDEYDHYMNEILPMSAQLTTKNVHINFGDEDERCPNPCTYQINAVHLNQNLWHTTSNPFSSAAAKLGWNISSSTSIDYVLDSVITSSSTSDLTMPNLATDFMTNHFNNGDSFTPKQNLPISCRDSSYISESSSSNKTSACKDKAISRTKRVSSSSQNDAAQKKQRAASQSSCPLPKVVKEKIGDRIAALHRLVAPFGKTDAASVLTEALGYIQFLHHQIQTLSMSCIKPSQSNRLRCFQRVSGKECWDAKQGDLKSRGLSLVPISVAAYVSSSSSVGLD